MEQRKSKRQKAALSRDKVLLLVYVSFFPSHVAYYLVNWSNYQIEQPEQKVELKSGRINLSETLGAFTFFASHPGKPNHLPKSST